MSIDNLLETKKYGERARSDKIRVNLKISLIQVWLLPALLGLAAISQAQSFQNIDRRTIQLFEAADWTGLIEEGEAALQTGFDYLGLRYRLGVAYFEEHRYFNSAVHFEAALKYDHYNRYTQEYLYYSYLFSGREKAARSFAKTFPPDLAQKIGLVKFRPVDFLYLEGGLKESSYPDSISRLPFTTFGVRHRLGYRFDLYQSVSYLEQSYFQTDFQQFEYYTRADWQLDAGLTLHPAFHYLDLSGKLTGDPGVEIDNPIGQSVWAAYLGLTITQNRWRIQPYLARIRAQTKIRYVEENPAFVFADETQASQYGLQLTYTPPLWKDRLWIYGQTTLHTLEGSYRTIWGSGLSVYFTSWLAMHFGYFSSDGAILFVEIQGALLNNSIDPVDDRWSGNLEFRFGVNSSLLLGYQRENKSLAGNRYYYDTIFLGLKLGL